MGTTFEWLTTERMRWSGCIFPNVYFHCIFSILPRVVIWARLLVTFVRTSLDCGRNCALDDLGITASGGCVDHNDGFQSKKIQKLERDKTDEISKREALEDRFSSVLDIEKEIQDLTASKTELEFSTEQVRSDYKAKKVIFDRLRSEMAVYDDRLSFAELGVYEPHFDFQDTESYKEAITEVRARQKAMISAKTAVTCDIEWTLDGSKSKGKTMTGRNIRLALRAFNNECEAAIANTRWNNVNAMEKRIGNARVQIDKLNESNRIVIEQPYIDLKLEELRLTHEYRERLKIEKDERAEASRLAREEAKLLNEAAAAQKKEEEYQALLDKARAEAGLATSNEIDAANSRVAELEQQLEEARERNERAQAMAEKTKSGYVYIISNIGRMSSRSA